MALIGAGKFYWRQKKCFHVTDKVKNATTLTVYSRACLAKPSEARTVGVIHRMRPGEKKKEKGKKKKHPYLTAR